LSEILALFDEHDKNWYWFREHYDELVEKFDGEFVAIHEQMVVDHDKEIGPLMERIRKNYSPKQVLVDFVSREKLALIL
jgi:hypothetical protein